MFIAPQRTRLWGYRAQLLVGRGRRKWKIQDAKFNQVLKGLDFLHPLTSQLQFFSSISHNCLFNCPFWINIIFLMFSASSWSVVYTFKDSCLLFPPLPQWLELSASFSASLLGFHCREFGELKEKTVLCLWCLRPSAWADSCPIRTTRPTLSVVLTLFPKSQTSLQTLIMSFQVEESTDILCGGSLAGSSAFLACTCFYHRTQEFRWKSLELPICWSVPLAFGFPEAKDLLNTALQLSNSYSARLPPSRCSANICLVVNWTKVSVDKDESCNNVCGKDSPPGKIKTEKVYALLPTLEAIVLNLLLSDPLPEWSQDNSIPVFPTALMESLSSASMQSILWRNFCTKEITYERQK